jgi:hypothetical protein
MNLAVDKPVFKCAYAEPAQYCLDEGERPKVVHRHGNEVMVTRDLEASTAEYRRR